MRVTVNGQSLNLEYPESVARLLERLDCSGRLAVEINRRIIPHSAFSAHIIRPGDKIEIINAVGGG